MPTNKRVNSKSSVPGKGDNVVEPPQQPQINRTVGPADLAAALLYAKPRRSQD